jgi:hypothetical protein
MTPDRLACADVRRRLEARVLGELAFREARAVSRHLAACEACVREAVLVSGLVRELRTLGGRAVAHGPARRARTVLVAGIAMLVAVALAEWRAHEAFARPASAALPESLERLIASQAEDGAWRARGTASTAFTIGMSGLAAVACLDPAVPDARAREASARGCDYLAKALVSREWSDADAAPEMRLRAQAAAAWALSAAARQWPDRYRRDAARAVVALRELADSWSDGGTPNELTRRLVDAAWREAGRRSAGAPTAAGEMIAQLSVVEP